MVQYVSLDALHPTQMTLGLREVERRLTRFMMLGPNRQAEYIAERVVPCVLGPAGQLYLVDRHHMCRVLLEAKAGIAVVTIIEKLDDVDIGQFWHLMDARGWAHPYDEHGQRRDVTVIPARIEDLKDDPYRSLVGDMRRANGIAKADLPFEEFAWANFLRERIPAALIQANFTEASDRALDLAGSSDARHLPGWIGR